MKERLHSSSSANKNFTGKQIFFSFALNVCVEAAMAWPSLLTSLFFNAQPWLYPEEPFNSAASQIQHNVVGTANKHDPTAPVTLNI